MAYVEVARHFVQYGVIPSMTAMQAHWPHPRRAEITGWDQGRPVSQSSGGAHREALPERPSEGESRWP